MTNDNVIDLAELRIAKQITDAIPQDQFGDGPWKREPNSAEWIDKDSGYRCLILRHPMLGHLCGYVGVFQSHPCYGRHYDSGKLDAIRVHGGLNYSSFRAERRLVQITPTTPWWFGFDCAHAFDLVPALDVGALKEFKAQLDAEMQEMMARLVDNAAAFEHTYRTFAWVTGEVGELVQQLRELE